MSKTDIILIVNEGAKISIFDGGKIIPIKFFFRNERDTVTVKA